MSTQLIDQPLPLETGQCWHLAYTRPRSEAVAAQQLARQGYEAYLPLYKTLKCGPDGLLPQRSPIGVTPATVGEALLSAVRAFEQQREQAGPEILSSLKPGRRVAVCEGTLKGLEGLVSTAAGQRVTVLLDVLGRQTRVRLPTHHLEVLAA